MSVLLAGDCNDDETPNRSPAIQAGRFRPRSHRQSFVANDVLHPGHMLGPGQEGYRTPAGEDFEHEGEIRQRLDALSSTNAQDSDSSSSPIGQSSRGHESDITARSSLRSDGASDATLAVPESSKGKQDGGEQEHAGTTNNGDWSSDGSTTVTATTVTQRSRRSGIPFSELTGASVRQEEASPSMNWRQRLRHFTWAYFTLTMATGGIANVLYHVPFRFSGLYAIGVVFFLLNVVLFLINVICISLRFYYHPSTFRNSFLHPTESLFAPAAVVSFGLILMNISEYGTDHVGYWLNTTVTALFWVQLGMAFVASFGTYLLFWSTQTFTIATMTPVWIFPAYPLLIIGPHAAVLSGSLASDRSAQILVGGFLAQGVGFLVSLMIYSAYIYRLMTQKLPLERMRPGMFVSVGPSAFTASGLCNMASHASRTWNGTDFMGNGDLAAMILGVIGHWSALWLWGLALWFFFVALGAHYTVVTDRSIRFPFAMTWFSFIFPQTALVNATFAIGGAFDLRPLQIIGCVMAVTLILMWLFVVIMMVRAVVKKQILWPQRGEDKDEGGFKGGSSNVDEKSRTEAVVRDASERV